MISSLTPLDSFTQSLVLREAAPSEQELAKEDKKKQEYDQKICYEVFAVRPLEISVQEDGADVRFMTHDLAKQICVRIDRIVNKEGEYFYSSPANGEHPGIFRVGIWSYADTYKFTADYVQRFSQTLQVDSCLASIHEYNCSKLMDSSKGLRSKYAREVQELKELAISLKANLLAVMKMLKKDKLSDEDVDRVQNYSCDCFTMDLEALEGSVREQLEKINTLVRHNACMMSEIFHPPKQAVQLTYPTLDYKHVAKLEVGCPNFRTNINSIYAFHQMHQTVLREHSIYFSKFLSGLISLRSIIGKLESSYERLLDAEVPVSVDPNPEAS